jgi:hypothetical protein
MGNIFDTDNNDHHEKRIHVYPRHHVEHMKKTDKPQNLLDPKLINVNRMSGSISDKGNEFADRILHLNTPKILHKLTKMSDINKMEKQNNLLKKLLELEYEKNSKLMTLLKLK